MKTRKKREKTEQKWARYGLKGVKEGRPKECEPRELTKDQLAGRRPDGGAPGGGGGPAAVERCGGRRQRGAQHAADGRRVSCQLISRRRFPASPRHASSTAASDSFRESISTTSKQASITQRDRRLEPMPLGLLLVREQQRAPDDCSALRHDRTDRYGPDIPSHKPLTLTSTPQPQGHTAGGTNRRSELRARARVRRVDLRAEACS